MAQQPARIDPPAALKLIEGKEENRFPEQPRRKARALGRMAVALERNKADHESAVGLINEAFDVLDQAAASGNVWGELESYCVAAASLLPMVEQIDARLVPEFLGRTLALRPTIPGPMDPDAAVDMTNACLAAMIARYDRVLGRQLLEGYGQRALDRQIGIEDCGSFNTGEELFHAAVAVDPAARGDGRLAERAGGALDPGAQECGATRNRSNPGKNRGRPLARARAGDCCICRRVIGKRIERRPKNLDTLGATRDNCGIIPEKLYWRVPPVHYLGKQPSWGRYRP